MLVGAGQLVEQRGLAAVLVAGEGEGQRRALGEGMLGFLLMEAAALAQTGVRNGRAPLGRRQGNSVADVLDFDFLRVRKTQRQLVAVNAQLHRVAHRRELDHGHVAVGDKTHVEKMLPQCAFAADRTDGCGLADGQIFECHICYLFFRNGDCCEEKCACISPKQYTIIPNGQQGTKRKKTEKARKDEKKPLHPDAGRSGKAQLFSAGAEKRASIRLNSRQKTSANSTPNTF